MSVIIGFLDGEPQELTLVEGRVHINGEIQPIKNVSVEEVEEFARNAQGRGLKVIIAAAGMAAALPGVIAANTTLPVIGVPIKGMLDGLDALLSIVQMPPGIPVATVGVNGALNAALLAVEMLALSDSRVAEKLAAYKEGLKQKIVKANAELAEVKYNFKTN